jgi:excisionase family DNA binding protein
MASAANKSAAPGTFTRSADDRLVSIATAASYLDVNPRTIYNMIQDGRLTAYTLGPRVLRIRLSQLDAALAPYGGPNAAT